MAGRRQAGLPAGSVVNIVDLSAETPWRGFALHGASKAGLAALTRAAAMELGPNVRVNAVAPGAILPPPGTAADSPEWLERGRALPVGQTGDPADVARAVVFLAQNPFVTGTVLHVDGGERLLSAFKH
jgi:pteridine reductase